MAGDEERVSKKRLIKVMLQPKTLRIFIWLLIVIAHFALAVVFISDRSPDTDAALTGFPLDDAWIHMVYGRSIANHGLPYYNKGELEAGFTSSIWMFIVALAELLARLFNASPVVVLKTLGILIAATGSVLLFEICYVLIGNIWISLAGALLLALDPVIGFSQISGMEVCLAAAFLLGAILMQVRDRFFAAGLLSSAAYLTRPETIVILPILFFTFMFQAKSLRLSRQKILNLAHLIVPTLVAMILWGSYCFIVNGHPLPNTFYVKFYHHDILEGIARTFGTIVLSLSALSLHAGKVLYLIGAIALAIRIRTRIIPVLILPYVFLVAVGATRYMPPGSGAYFYWLRYTVPALPFLFIPIAAGLYSFWNSPSWFQKRASRNVSPSLRVTVKILTIVLLIMCFLGYPKQLIFRKHQFAWNCQNINEVQVTAGLWIKQNLAIDQSVMTTDAGAILYFGNRRTIDLLGLNNSKVLFDDQIRYNILKDPEILATLASKYHTPYLLTFPPSFPYLMQHPDFQKHFTIVRNFRSKFYTVSPGEYLSTMSVFKLNNPR